MKIMNNRTYQYPCGACGGADTVCRDCAEKTIVDLIAAIRLAEEFLSHASTPGYQNAANDLLVYLRATRAVAKGEKKDDEIS